jgi:hypothetical protein
LMPSLLLTTVDVLMFHSITSVEETKTELVSSTLEITSSLLSILQQTADSFTMEDHTLFVRLSSILLLNILFMVRDTILKLCTTSILLLPLEESLFFLSSLIDLQTPLILILQLLLSLSNSFMTFLNSLTALAVMERLNPFLMSPDSGVSMSLAITMDTTQMQPDQMLAVDQTVLEHIVVMVSLMPTSFAIMEPETPTQLEVLVVSTAVFLLVVMVFLTQMKSVMMETMITLTDVHQSVDPSAVTESLMMSLSNVIMEHSTATHNPMHAVPTVVFHFVEMV